MRIIDPRLTARVGPMPEDGERKYSVSISGCTVEDTAPDVEQGRPSDASSIPDIHELASAMHASGEPTESTGTATAFSTHKEPESQKRPCVPVRLRPGEADSPRTLPTIEVTRPQSSPAFKRPGSQSAGDGARGSVECEDGLPHGKVHFHDEHDEGTREGRGSVLSHIFHQLFHRMPSTRRVKVQLIASLLGATLCLILSLGVGVPAVGRIYDPFDDVLNPHRGNGEMQTLGNFFGFMVVQYLGTASILLFTNFIPSFTVLDMRRSVLVICIVTFLLLCLVGDALVMVYLMEPQNTFTESTVTGTVDPIYQSIGCFFIFGFSFVAILCGGLLLNHVPSLAALFPRNLMNAKRRVISFFALFATLGYADHHDLSLTFQPDRVELHVQPDGGRRDLSWKVLPRRVAILAGQLALEQRLCVQALPRRRGLLLVRLGHCAHFHHLPSLPRRAPDSPSANLGQT